MKGETKVARTNERASFFGAALADDGLTVTSPAHLMCDDPIPGDTYRIGPYILTCITASAKTITGRIEG